MRVAVGVLTWNVVVNGREKLLEQTLASLQGQTDLVVVADNGSTDGTGEIVETYGGIRFPTLPGFPHGNTCGYGMNKLAATLHQTNADIVVLSNDDIVWKPHAVVDLDTVWKNIRSEVAVVSGLVEPTFALPGQQPWNDPISVEVVDGLKVLLRRSVPGGAWSYRNDDYKQIFPVSTFPGVDDVPACHRLLAQGRSVGCVDLAEHAGLGLSTWGNGSDRFMVEPLEAVRDRFGL